MTTWVILAGLPGVGKSTLARALVQQLGGAVLDKDRVREALFPGVLTDYTREQDDLCMRAILEAAGYLTGRIAFVFVDGRTFSRREQLEEVVSGAERAGARWRILHVVCAEEVAEARLSASDGDDPARNDNPARNHNPARNRDVSLYREIKARFEAIALPHLVVNTTDGIDAVLGAAAEYLRAPDDF